MTVWASIGIRVHVNIDGFTAPMADLALSVENARNGIESGLQMNSDVKPKSWISTTSFECRWIDSKCCGKIRQVRVKNGPMTEALLKLHARSHCKRCEAEYYRTNNQCPETVYNDYFGTPCGLTYAHDGRCVP